MRHSSGITVQITLRPLTDPATKHLEEHGSDWLIVKWHPRVQLFSGPGYWITSVKTKSGMWLRCAVESAPDGDKIIATIDDPDYKHIL